MLDDGIAPRAPPAPAATGDADDPYFSTLYSVMRVAVAGFGGALAGLSFARRGGGAAAAGRQAAAALSRTSNATPSPAGGGSGKARGDASMSKKGGGGKRLQRQRPIVRSAPPSTRPYADRDLPLAWAVACTAFAGIIEFTRVVSPTSFVLELTRGEIEAKADGTGSVSSEIDGGKDSDSANESPSQPSLDPSMVTISDYAIGGAFAGALFRGSAVRTKVGARLDSSIMGTASTSSLGAIKGRPLSGILPGAALGLIAGVSIVAMDRAQDAVEEYFGQFDGNEHVEEEVVVPGGEETPIPADIKAMSNEELMKSIEELRGGTSESDNRSGEDGQTEIDEDTGEKGVRDVISLIGFRPHPSSN